jgi:purine-cytosine permease-like protein
MIGSLVVFSTRSYDYAGDKEPVIIMAIILGCLYVTIYFMGLRMYRKTGRKWYRITSLVMGTIYLALIIILIVGQYSA